MQIETEERTRASPFTVSKILDRKQENSSNFFHYFPVNLREMDNDAKLRPDILQALFDQGFMGMEIEEEHGGAGLSFTSSCLVVEEISRIDPSVSIMVDIHNTLTNNAVRFWGSPELQQRWLPRLATDTVSSFCLSEAGSGSDAFAMKTTAIPNADKSAYTINGTKLWISNAKEAGVFLVFANASPDKGYKGITAFMVDAATEGVSVGPTENKLGTSSLLIGCKSNMGYIRTCNNEIFRTLLCCCWSFVTVGASVVVAA